MAAPLLDEQIRSNKRRTWFILSILLLILVGMVATAGIILQLDLIIIGVIALASALLYLVITIPSSVATVVSAAGARPADPNVRQEKLLLHRVEELSIAAGIPMPKVYVQNSKDINAFAAGRNPKTAIVCFTTGALEQLNQEELEGVVAHELSHIKNYDVRLATYTVAVVGFIAIMAEIILRSLRFAGRGRKDGGAGAVLLLVLAIVFMLLAPLISRLVYFAMSRRREYLADSNGAYLTRNPHGLASALEKIHHDLPDDPKGSQTVAALYISNPWKRALRESIWSTHPPLPKRIEVLRGGMPMRDPPRPHRPLN